MLKLDKVLGQVQAMADNVVDYKNGLADKMTLVQDCLGSAGWRELAERIEESKTSMLTAIPVGEVSMVFATPGVPKAFTVLATDGSQIVPDHHGPALCYLLNTGLVMIRYGTGERPLLDSAPSLFYKEEDLYLEINGKQVLIQGELLAAKRSELEAVQLEALMEKAKMGTGNPLAVALEDGSLIKWTLEQGAEWQVSILRRYLRTLDRARELNIPLVGYLSGSRASDVVNSLKLTLCPENPINCDKCPYKGLEIPCHRLNGVTDTMLFKRVLANQGDRSQVFMSTSKVLAEYGGHTVGFFYLNVGREIARVEIPRWVWEDPEKLSLVHGVSMDQAVKGMGYPVVLTEAHEQAVIKGGDRDSFFRLLEGMMVKRGVPVETSTKSLRKRVGYV